LQEFSFFCANRLRPALRMAGVGITVLAVCACQDAVDTQPPAVVPGTSTEPCGNSGYLTTELFGALRQGLDWRAAALQCEGMPRPDGDGARLRFAGSTDGARQLAIIIALPELRRGELASELATTITIIEEGSGRFFSNAANDICWTDVTGLEPMDTTAETFVIAGDVYCLAPLTQVNGSAEVLVRDLQFRGLLDWNAK